MTYKFLVIFIWTSVVANPSFAHRGKNLSYLNNISANDFQQCLEFGIQSVNQKSRLEDNLLNAQITVANGSLSHTLLLDVLPNAEAKADNEIAKKLLESSLCIYNTKCLPHGINGIECERFLSKKSLPLDNELSDQCNKLLNSRRNGHSSFRRLLPRRYKDGFYEMFSEDQLPSPLMVSRKMHESSSRQLQTSENSLAVAQWTQFIEHDLSKPVVTSMGDGSSIECCNKDSYELQPRYRHPSCAPLIESSKKSQYGRINCLNYVRSAVAVGSNCTFGAVEQLNQATGTLDLSQLYGFTDESKRRMRAFKNGEIKSSRGKSNTSSKIHTSQLPTIAMNSQEYCAFEDRSNHSVCFMAGDSRVNNNPLSISIYTIFMRNHNHIARKLSANKPQWSDDQIYEAAKAINVFIYSRIVFKEWLPVVLGKDAEPVRLFRSGQTKEYGSEQFLKISNEFAVAAIRFYLSMIPNRLVSFSRKRDKPIDGVGNNVLVLPDQSIFAFSDQIYKPYSMYAPKNLDQILESSLYQPAMKMDSHYEENLIVGDLDSSRPTHGDLFAFDVQRGRDHGLQGYIKYLELCSNTKIDDWENLEQFITKDNVRKLKSIYNHIGDIDLIVGSLSEIPRNDAIVGPTLSCILSEQFTRMLQETSITVDPVELIPYTSITAVDLLCANSDLQHVPQNIFLLTSAKNPLISCDGHLQALRFEAIN